MAVRKECFKRYILSNLINYMYQTKHLSTILKTLGLTAILALAATAMPAYALVAQESELTVTSRGMTATAEFTLHNPCAAYTLDWGDGEEVEQEETDMMCIQVVTDASLTHTYEEPGEYTVTFVHSGRTATQEVEVPTEVREFDLDDVESVTSLWVDPNEMMADEEYFIYTITLTDGEVVTVKAGGFTTTEWKNQQFADAGYTGEVDALVELAEPEEETEDPKPVPEESETEKKMQLQKQIIELLKQIIALLQLR